MRIVFMGTPEIAKTCLAALYDAGHDIAGVFTKIDTPKKRGMKLIPSEVKQYAEEKCLQVFQPVSLRDPEAVSALRALAPELVVVVAYGKILPVEMLDIPKYGCINIHASLLPLLRGAAPIQTSIMQGFKKTGVTAMYLSEGMDEGDIIDQREIPILSNDTTLTLTEKLAKTGAELLVDTVDAIYKGTASRVPQNSEEATYAPMLRKDMAPIDFTRSADLVSCQIRAMIPWPVATMVIGDQTFRVFDASATERKSKELPGTILAPEKEGLPVVCGDETVIMIRDIQAGGGKRMHVSAYLRGHPGILSR